MLLVFPFVFLLGLLELERCSLNALRESNPEESLKKIGTLDRKYQPDQENQIIFF